MLGLSETSPTPPPPAQSSFGTLSPPYGKVAAAAEAGNADTIAPEAAPSHIFASRPGQA